MDNRRIETGTELPVEYKLRTVRAGVVATYLVVAVLALYPWLPGADDVEVPAFFGLLAAALAGAALIRSLPWGRLFRAGHGDTVRYAWSVVDIVLVTMVLHTTGGPESPLFVLYALTTVFFAASYPTRTQLVLLAFTFTCFLALSAGADAALGGVVARLGILAVLVFLAGFLSLELASMMRAREAARAESERRAELLAVLATAGAKVNVLEPRSVIAAVMEALGRLGFEAAELCVIEESGHRYRVEESQGLPASYTRERHPSETGLVGRVLAFRRTVVTDYATLPDAVPALRDLGYRAVIGAPVWVDGRMEAVLSGGTTERAEVSPQEVEALELLAFQAGRALENAERFAEEHRAVGRLEELDRLKSDFISTASHELRTPLTVILGVSSTLATRPEDVPDDLRADLLDRLHANAHSLDQLVNALLDCSRLERGADPHLEELDLGEAVGEVARRLSPLLGDHLLTVCAGGGTPVRADALLVDRVMENLLANAAKHTPPGTPVTVRVERVDGEALVAVEDEGPGIAEEDLVHLGRRFFRGGRADTRSTRGLGLGLALANEVLAAHGSRLEVDSAPGEGARFSFRLPLVEAAGVGSRADAAGDDPGSRELRG